VKLWYCLCKDEEGERDWKNVEWREMVKNTSDDFETKFWVI